MTLVLPEFRMRVKVETLYFCGQNANLHPKAALFESRRSR